ncbi:VOC family protein [Legionella quateirensis]|uniref:Glyoxalase/bleomycin resistance protein n=1 Tax=Legionella quateirensis TaxID=45072 RepID=A0A378KQF7_9GAMM|nr:VOC family protein [Legionella quateirensis]KTD44659.1 glyoxalase/bleomycin resistance protein [Legionella quateirensis]STY16823.1 glyoxalase/bleomycin resistance protein [Legionella quateirensis]
MILDHVGITVSNYEKSKQFYTRILAPLSIVPISEHDGWIAFGKNGKAEFWFGPGKDTKYFSHITFIAETKASVDLFYKIAIDEGAVCNGKPKLRHDYYPGYYGAFVIDPDGHYIGAVIHNS